MKKQTLIATGFIAIMLPFSSFAATATHSGFVLNTGSILKEISQEIYRGNTTQSNNWNKFFQNQTTNQQPQNNEQFLKQTSGYAGLSFDYVYAAGTPAVSDNNQMPTYLYMNSNIDPAFNKQMQAGQTTGDFSKSNSQSIMDYAFQGTPNFQGSPQYISNVVNIGLKKPNPLNKKSQLAPATAIANSLNSIMQSYQVPAATTKTVNGKKVILQPPSQMQALHKAIQQPFTKKYVTDLLTASTPQGIRLLAELSAESNVMKYKLIRQNQKRIILQSNQLSQQMKTNHLLAENLAATEKLIRLREKAAKLEG